ncbi:MULTISPECIES: TonB-dependent receptor domain-containing protein [Pseudoalteromonas]|nr:MULTISPECIES: TonB-dependent receptor [Pseudoalteromonas]
MSNNHPKLLSLFCIMAMTTTAYAEVQEQTSIETITVTGSRIKRSVQSESSSPISSTELSDLADIGANDVRDLIEVLPFNAGSQNNSDNLTQNFTVGTSNVNLRGLGVSSTLVLLNGIRQVTSAVVTDQGASFVDTASLVPALAIKRVEILKDGASAIYGSDAVAGVVNFITRDDLEGAEVQYEYRTRWSEGSQDETKIDFAYGGYVGDSAHMLFAVSFLERSSLLLDEVDWVKPATSSFGNPGSFVIPSLADENNPNGLTVADPNCEANGGSVSQSSNDNSFCLFDFAPQITAVPNEDRLQAYARALWDWSDTTRMWAEFGYARNKISREVSPSFPVLNAPSVLVSHPDNPYEEDVFFRGRPYGVGKPTEINYYDHTTSRFAFGVDGEISDGIYWQASFVAAANDALVNPRDVITDNFQAALHGFGGNKCNGTTASEAGVGECYYFNPFDPQDPNNELLRDFIIGDYIGDAESEMRVFEAVITGDSLFEVAGGDVGYAIGIQYRDESITNVYDSFTQQDSFAFLIGNQNFTGERDVKAVFAEVLMPITENLEIGAAVRYEDYGDFGGDTTNPKFSFLWLASDTLSLRGTFSTSFRAPSVHQLQGVQTNFANITDPEDGSTTFGGNRTIGDPDLVPETSEALNLGLTYSYDEYAFDIDYWDFSFEDVLTRESHQAVVNANPNDPTRVIRTSAGTISIVNTKFVNAEAIDTSGIDINASTIYQSDFGDFSPQLTATYLLRYDLMDASGQTTDGLGQLNLNTVGNPSPRLRGSIGLNWSNGIHRANVFIRHVASYNNDVSDESIDAFNTLDVQYSVNMGQVLKGDSETKLTLGVINVTDEAPPYVAVAGSYDPRTGDPRGRRAYAKLQISF